MSVFRWTEYYVTKTAQVWRMRIAWHLPKRAVTDLMDPSVLSAMDKDALKKQIENMKYQATMERWPLSKSIAA